jgi:cyclase
VLVSVVLIGVLSVGQQQDFSQVQIKAQKVAGSVYMLEGRGGNIGVSVGDDGMLIVDDQFAPLAEKIEAALMQIARESPGKRERPLKFVLNTHWHGDHTGGNARFGQKADIIAHENVRKRLASGGSTRFGKVEPAPREALPIITFDSKLTAHINGEDIRAIHFPNGHTDGDSVIFFTQSNVVHMGDDFFAGRFPFVDLDSGGSVQGLIAGVDKVLNEIPDDVKVIPGHGPLSTKQDLHAYLDMLKETSSAVQKAIKQGRSLEQIKAAKLFSPKFDAWGTGFINADIWAEILFRSYSEKRSDKNPRHPHGHTYLRGGNN